MDFAFTSKRRWDLVLKIQVLFGSRNSFAIKEMRRLSVLGICELL
jgi:hypothetical protein